MMRKIGLTLLVSAGLFNSSAFSTTEYVLKVGRAFEYEIPINDPQVFSNFYFWKITATCKVESESPENILAITMIRKTGSVNSILLTPGDSVGLTLQSGDILDVSVDPGAKVELLNSGQSVIKASCSTV